MLFNSKFLVFILVNRIAHFHLTVSVFHLCPCVLGGVSKKFTDWIVTDIIGDMMTLKKPAWKIMRYLAHETLTLV